MNDIILDRLLVKIVDTNKKYNMQEQIPYESANIRFCYSVQVKQDF